MVSMATKHFGDGRRYSWSLYQILERQQRHSHRFHRFNVSSVLTAMVKNVSILEWFRSSFQLSNWKHFFFISNCSIFATDTKRSYQPTDMQTINWQFGSIHPCKSNANWLDTQLVCYKWPCLPTEALWWAPLPMKRCDCGIVLRPTFIKWRKRNQPQNLDQAFSAQTSANHMSLDK